MIDYGVTQIHPLAFLATLVAGITLLAARRSSAFLAVALIACLIPVAQRVVVAGLNFNMIRVLVLFGWIRALSRGETRYLRLNELDFAFLTWTVVAGTMYVIRDGSAGALVYRLGLVFDAAGVYLLIRMLLRRPDDCVQAAVYLALCAVVVVVPMTIERATGHNLFSVFGGVPAITMIRDGKLRCQGAFTHPIMVGSFGACLVPIFIGMYFAFPRRRVIALVGLIASVAIAVLATSSGALISLVAGIGGFALWPLRRRTRVMRWGLLAVLTILHVSREKPVWHLIARVSDLLGGEGYHRFRLIDAFVNNWREWFLVGTPSTLHWGWMLWDTTNQYVDEAVNGGILALISFVVLVSLTFRAIGTARAAGGAVGRSPLAQGLWCWGLGCAMLGHSTAFISVAYYGQTRILFFMFLALVSSEYSFVLQAVRRVRKERMLVRGPMVSEESRQPDDHTIEPVLR